ncbi:hypothetical protein PybrP1_004103, partial [[Pythium] brassicae (nom. inval.)]
MLKQEDAAQLDGLAHAFVCSSIKQNRGFVFGAPCRRAPLEARHENATVFAECRQKEILADADGPEAPVLCNPTAELPALIICGTIKGKLDDAVFGYVSPTLDWMRIKTLYVDGKLARSTNRDFVYMKSAGVDALFNGERVGYHLMHSVQFPETPDLDSALRGNASTRGIYRQRTESSVDIYIRGKGRGVVTRSIAGSCSDSGRSSSGGGRDGGGRCASCGKSPSVLLSMTSKARSTCKICLEAVCSTCWLRRKLGFFTREQRLVQTESSRSALVLFRLSARTTTALLSDPQRTSQALQTLRSHGFRLGFVGGAEWSEDEIATRGIASSFDVAHFGHAPDKAMYAQASQALNVPLGRTLLVTDAV